MVTNGTQVDSVTDLSLINILTYVFLCVVTFGIGSAIDLSHLRLVLRKRKAAFCVGLLAQYVAMPSVARLVASTFLSMPDVSRLQPRPVILWNHPRSWNHSRISRSIALP